MRERRSGQKRRRAHDIQLVADCDLFHESGKLTSVSLSLNITDRTRTAGEWERSAASANLE